MKTPAGSFRRGFLLGKALRALPVPAKGRSAFGNYDFQCTSPSPNNKPSTDPEMTVRKMLYRLGYRYRLHRKGLPGLPIWFFPSDIR